MSKVDPLCWSLTREALVSAIGAETAPNTEADVLNVGLLVNMSGASRVKAKRQFLDQLQTARFHKLNIRLFSLFSTDDAEYSDVEALEDAELDGLIVTGCEPKLRRLQDEDFWPKLTRVIDWAESNTYSTIWSCLSAHAVVLHMDGIERRRLAKKCSGLYRVDKLADHQLSRGFAATYWTPHSRWNALDPNELSEAGYTVLTGGTHCGPDIFTKQWRSLFVHLQGHPEYGPDTLGREYRRDINRYADGASKDRPSVPENYYSPADERRLRDLEVQVYEGRASVRDIPIMPSQMLGESGRSPGRALFTSWLNLLSTCVAARDCQKRDDGGQRVISL